MSYEFWLLLGLFLVVAEFFIPGLVIIFFGAGALVTGVVKLLWNDMPDGVAFLLFAIASLCSLLLIRKTWAGGKVIREGNTKKGGDMDEMCVGRKVAVVEEISPGKVGKVELNGANWNAESEETLSPGATAVVVERRGLTLVVKAQ